MFQRCSKDFSHDKDVPKIYPNVPLMRIFQRHYMKAELQPISDQTVFLDEF
jgi:hypothetical protein